MPIQPIALTLIPDGKKGFCRPQLEMSVVAARPNYLIKSPSLVMGIVDTGASRSTIPAALLDSAFIPRLPKADAMMANGNLIPLPLIDLTLRVADSIDPFDLREVYVTDKRYMLLGCDFLDQCRAQLQLSISEQFGQLLVFKIA